ncbi:MAG: signal peptidase, partial [Ardenticatenales bacterium]|nr:signal peptidase [Ardenticatenales bacterium]
LTFYYGSEKEVDLFRLQRELGKRLDTRVEFRQIGPRDVAKMMGGSGACGLSVRCCSAFLTDFQPISIRMAKAQDLPLVPTEIAGMCGRLRCCLAYEYEFYKDARKGLPKLGKWVVSQQGAGKVVDRNIPKQTVTIQMEGGTRLEMPIADLWVGEGQPPVGGGCGTGGGGCGGACSSHH